jgi:hypothetical protein
MAVISVKEVKWVGVWVGERGFGTEVIVVCSLFFTSMRPQADFFLDTYSGCFVKPGPQ